MLLAGGEARALSGQLERDVGGVPMIVRVYRNACAPQLARLRCRQRLVSRRRSTRARRAACDRPLARRGPLAALLSACSLDAHRAWVFAIAGDVPLVDADMLERARASAQREGDEAVVPAARRRASSRSRRSTTRRAFLREGSALLRSGRSAMRGSSTRIARARSFRSTSAYFHNVNREADLEARSHRVRLERSIAAFARARRRDRRRRQLAGARIRRRRRLSPVFMKSASGAMIYDLDGHEYLDYVLSWGPLILGPRASRGRRAIAAAASAARRSERRPKPRASWPSWSSSMVPSIARMRFVSSGTEATIRRVRLARGFTGRAKIVKFAGCYHGHGDSFLIAAGRAR